MEILVTFLASFLVWFLYAGVFVLWIIDGRIKKEQVLHALFSSILAWVITQIIKSIIPMQRPFMMNGALPMTLTTPADGTFPSGHAALAFGLSTSIYLHEKRLGFLYLLGAVLVGAGRVLANVHFPLDIIGGAVIGVSVALSFDKLHLFEIIKKLKV